MGRSGRATPNIPFDFRGQLQYVHTYLCLQALEDLPRITLRQYPVDAFVKIFDSSDIAPLPRPGPPRRLRRRHGPSQYLIRRKFARIQLVNIGVLNPTSELAQKSQQDPNMLPGPVPIIIRLEPLLFGVLPQSVVPTLYTILAAVATGVLIARVVIRRLQDDVEDYLKAKAGGDSKKTQ